MADFIASLMLLVGVPVLVGSVALWWHGVRAERRWIARIQQEHQQIQEMGTESEQHRDSSCASTPG